MFEIYRIHEKKEVLPTIIVCLKKRIFQKKEIPECKIELFHACGLNHDKKIIFIGKILDGKRLGQRIAITEIDIKI